MLEEALSVLDAAGAPSWAARARAELVASGLSNQEVPERAFLSAKTVEANLTRVYRKLGVRSRVDLANALRDPT